MLLSPKGWKGKVVLKTLYAYCFTKVDLLFQLALECNALEALVAIPIFVFKTD